METLASFLDVHTAFDNVNLDILIEKLVSIGCSRNILVFVKHLMHTRFIYSQYNEDVPRMVCKGVPQGGVLSPLLHLLYVSDITVNVPKNVTTLQSADDLADFIKFKALKRNKRILENAVKRISENLYNIELDLSPTKTVLVHLNNNNKIPLLTALAECFLKEN